MLGGLASRHDLTIESFEDLLLALDGLLDRSQGEPAVTLTVRVDGDEIQAEVGPFAAGSVRTELERQTRTTASTCDGSSTPSWTASSVETPRTATGCG